MTEGFFVGWSGALPRGLRRPLGLTAFALLAAAPLLALALGAGRQDPAGPGFGEGSLPLAGLPSPEPGLEGVLTLRPYPVLHTAGRSLLLSGDGKAPTPGTAPLEGQRVAMGGFTMARGDIAMLVSGAPPEPRPGEASPPVREPLGRWRITGEICDGKCAPGLMRPGIGIAHRACAVLCLDSELPAVFVATAPVVGHAFLLMGDADGGPIDPALRPHVGRRLTLEGEVERLGTLLVFRAEPPR